MKQVPIKLGPLTLLLTLISICLTTLAILNFTTARADLRLAEKYAETVQTRYALEREGQEFLQEIAGLDENDLDLYELERDQNGTLWRVFERDGAKLRIGLRPGADGMMVVAWRQEKEWTQDETIGNLWMGF